MLRFDAPPVHTPCDKLPDGPLLGNGDIGVAVSAAPQEGKLRFHIGKNDLWNSYSHWETPGMRSYGVLELTLLQAGGTYRAAQHLADASVSVVLEGQEASVEVSTTVLRKTGLMVQSILCAEGSVEIGVGLTHTNRGTPRAQIPCRSLTAMALQGLQRHKASGQPGFTGGGTGMAGHLAPYQPGKRVLSGHV